MEYVAMWIKLHHIPLPEVNSKLNGWDNGLKVYICLNFYKKYEEINNRHK